MSQILKLQGLLIWKRAALYILLIISKFMNRINADLTREWISVFHQTYSTVKQYAWLMREMNKLLKFFSRSQVIQQSLSIHIILFVSYLAVCSRGLWSFMKVLGRDFSPDILSWVWYWLSLMVKDHIYIVTYSGNVKSYFHPVAGISLWDF